MYTNTNVKAYIRNREFSKDTNPHKYATKHICEDMICPHYKQ